MVGSPVKTSSQSAVAKRQQTLREKRAKEGVMPCTVWVPKECCADMRQLAGRLVADRDLMPGPPRRRNGRYAKQRGPEC